MTYLSILNCHFYAECRERSTTTFLAINIIFKAYPKLYKIC